MASNADLLTAIDRNVSSVMEIIWKNYFSKSQYAGHSLKYFPSFLFQSVTAV